MDNPYLTKSEGKSQAPLILRVPMHDFESGEHMEAELLPEEMCFARIENKSQPTGYTHHVALVYKNSKEEVFSLTMAQHHGEMKPGTLEELHKKGQEIEEKDNMPEFRKQRKKKKKNRRKHREQ